MPVGHADKQALKYMLEHWRSESGEKHPLCELWAKGGWSNSRDKFTIPLDISIEMCVAIMMSMKL